MAVVAVAGIVVALGLSACSDDDAGDDREATEDAVAEVVADGLGVEVDDVACPDLPLTAGATAACRGVLADGVGEVRIEVHRAADDGATLDVEVLDAVVDRAEVAGQLRDELTATYERDFTVDCGGDGLEVVAPDSSFVCDATDDEGARDVTVTVTDRAGTLRFDVAGGPGDDEGG